MLFIQALLPNKILLTLTVSEKISWRGMNGPKDATIQSARGKPNNVIFVQIAEFLLAQLISI